MISLMVNFWYIWITCDQSKVCYIRYAEEVFSSEPHLFLNDHVLDLRYGKRLIFTKKKMGAQTAEEQASDTHSSYGCHYHCYHF